MLDLKNMPLFRLMTSTVKRDYKEEFFVSIYLIFIPVTATNFQTLSRVKTMSLAGCLAV